MAAAKCRISHDTGSGRVGERVKAEVLKTSEIVGVLLVYQLISQVFDSPGTIPAGETGNGWVAERFKAEVRRNTGATQRKGGRVV